MCHCKAGEEVAPLRMIIHGEGGTGKSRVIQTITDLFASKGAAGLLVKGAYTGIAASLIGRKTLHNIGHIPVHKSQSSKAKIISDETRQKIQDFWRTYIYLIIDEYSMISKSFFNALEKNIALTKAGNADGSTFGGISVILCGDLHQFPPVVGGLQDALYVPVAPGNTEDQKLGRHLYEEFKTVVILTEQMRIIDPEWCDFLRKLRHGEAQKSEVETLQKLVLGDPNCIPLDTNATDWSNASLVTPRHGVRRAWNEAALHKYCEENEGRMYICPARDTIKKRPLSLAERYGLALRMRAKTKFGKKRNIKNDLPEYLSIAIGAQVMVVQNIETDLDLANGARGTIIGIVLDPLEPDILEDQSIVHLQHPPLYILVKMERSRILRLDGLEDGVIPIQPRTQNLQISVQQRKGKPAHRTVRREQLPLTLAYAFTDYRAQGQTIVPVLIDIATPPGGKLNLFNVYVALSRSAGRHSLRLLRGFDPRIIMQGHTAELLMEDDRLRRMDQVTRIVVEQGRKQVA